MFDFKKYFKEGEKCLKDGDVIQASEKFYKCAEEAIKVLSEKYKIKEWEEDNLLFDAADRLSGLMKENVGDIWRKAWIMHTEGFHEKRLRKEIIERWKDDIKKLIEFVNK